jgi:heptose I phosphotransferase
MIELDSDVAQHLQANGHPFDALMQMTGQVVRQHKNRTTMRVQIGGREYFLKIHGPTAWKEIFKNVLRLRWPVLTAQPERRAIAKLQDLNIPSTIAAGYGCRGQFPHRLESFLLTASLAESQPMLHLSELPARMAQMTPHHRLRLQRQLIRELARVARRLHMHGLNHRDFYLCHFMIADRNWSAWQPRDSLRVFVIDLHRMQIRRHPPPQRWILKDLSGLLFSALDCGLTSRDYLRFLGEYWRRPWRSEWGRSKRWRKRLVRRALSLYRSEHGRSPRLPASLANFA